MTLQFRLFVGIYQLQHWLAVTNTTLRWTHSFLPLFRCDVMMQITVLNIAAWMAFCLSPFKQHSYFYSLVCVEFERVNLWHWTKTKKNKKKKTERQTRLLVIGGRESAIFRGITMINNFGVKSRLHSLQYRVTLREAPDRACDRVAACPHLVVNLDRRQLPADPVVRAAYGEPGLRQRALVSGHAGRRLFWEKRTTKKLPFNEALSQMTNKLITSIKNTTGQACYFGFTTEM